MRLVRFPAGHVVFAQGDPGGALFLIVSGIMRLLARRADVMTDCMIDSPAPTRPTALRGGCCC
jgi:CRP-like cAMP-binding protein